MLGESFTESLAHLLSRQMITHFIPPSGSWVVLDEASIRTAFSYRVNNRHDNEGLLELGSGTGVAAQVNVYRNAKPSISNVIEACFPATTHNIVVGRNEALREWRVSVDGCLSYDTLIDNEGEVFSPV